MLEITREKVKEVKEPLKRGTMSDCIEWFTNTDFSYSFQQ